MKTSPPFQHREAFCLMVYLSKSGIEAEILWNSRDGVTPFIILDRKGENEMSHAFWEADICVPDFVPPVGMRIFVDATPELMRPHAIEYVDTYWNDPELPMKKHPAFRGKSKEEVVEAFVRRWCTESSPHVITVPDSAVSWPDGDET